MNVKMYNMLRIEISVNTDKIFVSKPIKYYLGEIYNPIKMNIYFISS